MPATIDGVDTSTVFTVKLDCFAVAPGPPPNDFGQKRVLVTVSWHEGMGGDRSTRLETLVVE
jgi:hypothetical protein